jgi:hypothetical protein
MAPPAALDRETARRHRVLIAAAVAAVVQDARIRDIKPAAWTRRRAASVKPDPDFRRHAPTPEPELDQHPADEEEAEVSCGS